MGFLIKMYCHKIYYHIIHENKPQLYSQKISPVELNYKNLRATRGLSHIFCSCENGSYIGNKVRFCRHRLSLYLIDLKYKLTNLTPFLFLIAGISKETT